MRFILFLMLLAVSPLHANLREYSRPLTSSEQEGVSYLMTTLGSHSAIALAFYKGRLEQAGAQTEEIHPLRFFEFVVLNPHLHFSMKKISGIPWSRFTSRMATNFEGAANRGDLTPEMIQEFAQNTGLDEQSVASTLQNRQWKSFMNSLKQL